MRGGYVGDPRRPSLTSSALIPSFEEDRIFDRGYLWDAFDVIGAPGYFTSGIMEGMLTELGAHGAFAEDQTQWERYKQSSEFDPNPVRALLGFGWQGLKHRGTVGRGVQAIAPEWSAEHPWGTAGAGLAGDIALYPGAAVSAVARPVAARGGALLRAGTEAIPRIGPDIVATFNRIRPAIHRVEQSAKSLLRRDANDVNALTRELKELGEPVDEIVRGIDETLSGVFRQRADEAVAEYRGIHERAAQVHRWTERATEAERQARRGLNQMRSEGGRSKMLDRMRVRLGRAEGERQVLDMELLRGERQLAGLGAKRVEELIRPLARGGEAVGAATPETRALLAASDDLVRQLEARAEQLVTKHLRGPVEAVPTRQLRLNPQEIAAVREVERLLAQATRRRAGVVERATTEARRGRPVRGTLTSDPTAVRMRDTTARLDRLRGNRGRVIDRMIRLHEGIQSRGQSIIARWEEKVSNLSEGIGQAQTTLDDLFRRGVALGEKNNRRLVRHLAPARVIQDIRTLAEHRHIGEAHDLAQAFMDKGIDDLARTVNPDYAQQVRTALTKMQDMAVRRSRRLVSFGTRTEEEMAKYGKFHLWRGYDMNVHPDDFLEYLRVQGGDEGAMVAAAMEVTNRNLRGVGGGRSGLPSWIGKQRQHLTPEQLKQLGELPVAERFLIGEYRAAREISEAYRLRSFAKGYGLNEEGYLALDDVARNRFVALPDEKRWGPFKNPDLQYIPKWLAAHLGFEVLGSGWEQKVARLISWGLPARSGEVGLNNPILRGWIHNVVGPWKLLHAPGNIPTQVRNFVTNALLTYIVGKIPAPYVIPYLIKGWRSFARMEPAYLEASRRNPGFMATAMRHEVLKLGRESPEWGPALEKYAGFLRRGGRKFAEVAGELYERSEITAKMAVYLYHTDPARGAARLSSVEAAKLAVDAIFDYGDVSRVTNALRRTGVVPFLTFPVKAARAMGRAAIESPERLQRVGQTMMMAPSRVASQEQRNQFFASQPEWMSRGGGYIPFQHGGETYSINVGYMLPWGPVAEGGIGAWGMAPLQIFPIPHILEDIARNQDSFTGREIVNPELSGPEQVMAKAAFLVKQLGPGWIVRGLPRLATEYQPQARPFEEPEQSSIGRLARTVAGEFGGVRIRPYRAEPELRMREMDSTRRLQDLNSWFRRQQRLFEAGAMSEAKFQRKTESWERQRQGILEELERRESTF